MPRRQLNDPAHIFTDKAIAKMEKQIAKEYRQANKEVAAKLDDYLRRFTLKDKKWRQWVKEGKRKPEEYQKWLTGQVIMGKRWEELKDKLADDYVNAHHIAEKIINGYKGAVYAENINYATYDLEKGLGVDTSYTLYNRDAIERLWRENPKFYKKAGKDTLQKIKDGEIKRWNKQQIQSIMIQGILQGESIPKLAKRLEKVSGGEYAAAIRNARTMMTGIQNAGRLDAYNRAHSMGISIKKKWVAVFDRRTRHAHRLLDGQVRDLDKPFEVDGEEIMFPGDITAPGYLVYNCRCSMIRSRAGHEIDIRDDRVTFTDKYGSMTYDEWKADKRSKSQPITYQADTAEAIRQAYIWEYMR